MTTYTTISEAFANGTGDVFFTKDNNFVCFSRHDDNREEMKALGFTCLTYPEVAAIGSTEKAGTLPPVIVAANSPKLVKSKPFYDYFGFSGQGYYDEFPDAYGQTL